VGAQLGDERRLADGEDGRAGIEVARWRASTSEELNHVLGGGGHAETGQLAA